MIVHALICKSGLYGANSREQKLHYRFENIEIDSTQYTVRLAGTEVAIEPKVFDVILYLIEHRHRVVSRDELFESIWQGRSVSDTTLSNHIKTARNLLGDDGERQRIIKTVRTRGYQFVAILDQTSKENSHHNDRPPQKKTIRPAHRWQRLAHWRVMLVFVSLIAVTLGIYALISRQSTPHTPPYLLVLPLSVSSQNPLKWQPFSDQITRELIQNLRKVNQVKTVPPPSSFTFKGQKNRQHIRQQLPDLDYVLDGMVSIDSNENMRISIELEHLASGQLIWDGDYQMNLREQSPFSIQNDITSAVASSLKAVMAQDSTSNTTARPYNLAAYEHFVLGQYQLSLMNHQAVLNAIEHFNQSIALDPEAQAAYVAKATAYRILMTTFDKPSLILPKVIAATTEILSINPDSAQVMSQLGLAYVHAWQWDEAWKMLNKAQQQEPDNALTQLGFALFFAAMGQNQQVLDHLAAADKLDPLNEEVADWGMWALMMINELETAQQWGRIKLTQHPDSAFMHLNLGVAKYLTGDLTQSHKLMLTGVTISERAPYPLILLAQSYAAAGQNQQALDLIAEAQRQSDYVCPYETAAVYALLDLKPEMYQQLEQAISYQSNCLIFTRQDPRFKPYHTEARFKSVLEIIGLAELKHYDKAI